MNHPLRTLHLHSSSKTFSGHFILLGVGVLCIAWSAIFVKLSGLSGLTTAFYRMAIASVGILPIWAFRRKPITSSRGVFFAMLCGVFFACDIALWNTSIVLSKASISTLLANLSPVWVGLGALLFWKQKPNGYFWIGTAIAIGGVALIIGVQELFSTTFSMGNVLAITASMFYGAYMLTAQKGRIHIDTLSFTAISMATSTVILGVFCILFKTPLWGFSTNSWSALVGVGLISQLCGWLCINYALKYIRPTTASVTLLSQSVFTALFSIPVLGEMLTWYEVCGAVVVLSGIYLVNNPPVHKSIPTQEGL
jgi:drug/metabolite transporter (DMT)-like permease